MTIDLFDLSNNTNKTKNPKQYSTISPMSSDEARAAAQRILETGVGKAMRSAIRMMHTAGALPQYHIPVSGRTARLYHKRRIFDRLPYTSAQIRDALRNYGLPVPDEEDRALVYTLGPVGVELAREMFENVPSVGYLGATLERLMHDLTVNEIVLRISASAMAAGWRPIWYGKYEGTLRKDRTPILEPDAFMKFKKEKEGDEKAFLVEYHNEDKSTRAASKVRKYEAAYQSNLWQEQWEVDKFPPVLAVYREKIVGKGYNDEVSALPHGNVLFYGRSLEGFFQDETVWYDFRRREKVSLISWR